MTRLREFAGLVLRSLVFVVPILAILIGGRIIAWVPGGLP